MPATETRALARVSQVVHEPWKPPTSAGRPASSSGQQVAQAGAVLRLAHHGVPVRSAQRQQGGAGLVRRPEGGVRRHAAQHEEPDPGPGLGVAQQRGPAAVAGDGLGLPRRHREVGATRQQLHDGLGLAGDEPRLGDVRHDADAVGALAQRGAHRRGGRGPLAGEDDVHLPGAERPRGGDHPVQDEVRAGQGERGVLAAGRLALAHVDHQHRARALLRAPRRAWWRTGSPHRRGPSADPAQGLVQLLGRDLGRLAVLLAVRGQRRAALDAGEQGRAGLHAHVRRGTAPARAGCRRG